MSITARTATDYDFLFKSPKGHSAGAHVTAFDDIRHWGEQAGQGGAVCGSR